MEKEIINIWHISDTHSNHEELIIPNNIDLLIHSGDSTNYRDYRNCAEAECFFNWLSNLEIKNKILIAGNHDFSLLYKFYDLSKYNFTYLENSLLELKNNIVFGYPYTPKFHDWFFMLNNKQLQKFSENIPDCDILISHGPPKYILDSVLSNKNLYEHCGDIFLYEKVKQIKPKLHLFGHIHSTKDINYYPENNGIFFDGKTYYINSACCNDYNIKNISNHGHIIKYNLKDKLVLNIKKNEL